MNRIASNYTLTRCKRDVSCRGIDSTNDEIVLEPTFDCVTFCALFLTLKGGNQLPFVEPNSTVRSAGTNTPRDLRLIQFGLYNQLRIEGLQCIINTNHCRLGVVIHCLGFFIQSSGARLNSTTEIVVMCHGVVVQ